MLNKNFNIMLSTFSTGNSNTYNGYSIDNTTNGSMAVSGLSELSLFHSTEQIKQGSASSQTGVFLFTEKFNESINTVLPVTEFTDYSVVSASKNSRSDMISMSYTRTIHPNSNALIKAIAIITKGSSGSAMPCMIAFENLAEPVQLTAGEPHTFTFTIKVWHILDKK